MSDTAQEKDPSIEEILASIRQIISDDDDEGETDGEAVAEPVPEPEPEPEPEEPPVAPEAPEEDDVLELTEKAEEEPEVFDDEIEVDLTEPDEVEEVVAAPPPPPEPPAPPPPPAPDSRILTETASAATLAGFTKLARDIQINRSFEGITLEDVVRNQLEPLLREWLDKNLPPMIEVLVEKELERLSKKALND